MATTTTPTHLDFEMLYRHRWASSAEPGCYCCGSPAPPLVPSLWPSATPWSCCAGGPWPPGATLRQLGPSSEPAVAVGRAV